MKAIKNKPDRINIDRRPLEIRSAKWAKALSLMLAGTKITPNQVSLLSLFFAAFGAMLFWFSRDAIGTTQAFCFIGCAICIQSRLLCNMLDGMIAVEGGKSSKVGELYNEIPDRIADVLFLVAAGFACNETPWGAVLGWSAACLSLMTAYLRTLGSSQGLKQDFCGPMAKPHRMFLLTVGSLATAGQIFFEAKPTFLFWALVVINFGALITCIRRTLRLANKLEAG